MTPRYTTLKDASGKVAPSDDEAVRDTVQGIIADVRENGDAAVRRYSEKFDRWSPESFRLSDERIAEIVATVPEQVLDDIRFVQAQVRRFAEAQRASLTDFEIE